MIRAVVAVALLVVAGWLPARRLVARPVVTLVASPLLGALVLVPAGVLSVLTSSPPLPWAAGTAALAAWLTRRGAADGRWVPAVPILPVVALLAVLAVPLAIFLTRPPVDWDAHSIWLHHSNWFFTGGEAAHRAFSAETFSHADYPPLLTAPAGILARAVGGSFEWRVAQLVIAAIAWSAFATAGVALLDTVRRPWVAVAGMAATAGFAVAVLYVGLANAEADFAAASTVAAAAVLLLLRPDPDRVGLGLAAATAAALCKGESLTAAVAVVALAWLVAGRPRSWWWAVPVAAGGLWVAVARTLGAQSYLTRGGGLTPSRVADRAWPAVERLWSEMRGVAPAAVVAVVVCAVLVPSTRRSLAALVLAALASVTGLVLVYVVGDIEIGIWLDTSARRVSTGPGFLLAIAAVFAADACLDLALGDRGSTPGRPATEVSGGR